MFEGFNSFKVTTDRAADVTIYGLKNSNASSTLPPLLLLHGFPQSRHIWHRVAPQLTEKYDVVILDIRGYGESSKPEQVEAYAKSAMARDCVKVMDNLGFSSFFICAHDRGARVAHKLCVDYPDHVKKAIFLDICPTLAMYTATDFEFAKSYFHWFFLIQKEPLPESSILSNARKFAEIFMGGRQQAGLKIFDEEPWDYYVKGLEDPATVHAMCQDYRASATLDLEESRDDLAKGRLLQCPLLVIWGKHGVIEKCFDAVKEWRAVARKGVSVGGYSIDSGHYVAEEAPDDITSAILDFLT
ncbi:Fc.00g104920.m01.CDS01 [Cosmosporella sp. VM-42]